MTAREMVKSMVATQLEVTVLPMGKAVVTASERFLEQRATLVALLEAGEGLRHRVQVDMDETTCGDPDCDICKDATVYDAARAAAEKACTP